MPAPVGIPAKPEDVAADEEFGAVGPPTPRMLMGYPVSDEPLELDLGEGPPVVFGPGKGEVAAGVRFRKASGLVEARMEIRAAPGEPCMSAWGEGATEAEALSAMTDTWRRYRAAFDALADEADRRAA